MSEEFITDIIGATEADKAVPVKTEAEMIAELQGDPVEKPAEKSTDVKVAEVTMGAEGDPDSSGDEKDQAIDDSAIKEIATQLGWREDHTGEDAVDAKTYILRSKDIQKSMSQYNKDLKSQLSALDGSVEALKKHNESVYKAELKKLTGEIDSLKAERRAAIELADVVKVEELDKQIDDIQKDINAPKPVETQTDNPVYDEWVKDNDWYLNDDAMATFADSVAEQYIGAPLERVYAIVRTKVQEIFPDKFETIKPTDVAKSADVVKPVGPKSPVESSSGKVSGTVFTKADLTDDQRQIMTQFVKGGIMTEEAYVNDIAKMQQ